MTLRTASTGDLDALLALINTAYLVERSFVNGDRTAPEAVRRLMTKGAFLIGLDDAGAACACVYVEVRGRRGYFGLLAVDPARQRGGWGTRMIDAAEGHCRAAGCDAMDIRVVNLRVELPPFYRRLGYVETATEPFDDPRAFRPCHMIVMSKTL